MSKLRELHKLVITNSVNSGADMQLEGKLSFCKVCVQKKMHRLSHQVLKDIKLQLVYTVWSNANLIISWQTLHLATDDYSLLCRTSKKEIQGPREV